VIDGPDRRPGSTLPGVLDHSGAQAALRAQILATEHWSLLATRGMTWSEIFSRTGISIASQALGAVAALQIAIGLLAALGSGTILGAVGYQRIARLRRDYRPLFPS
jgi:hypothetical protein